MVERYDLEAPQIGEGKRGAAAVTSETVLQKMFDEGNSASHVFNKARVAAFESGAIEMGQLNFGEQPGKWVSAISEANQDGVKKVDNDDIAFGIRSETNDLKHNQSKHLNAANDSILTNADVLQGGFRSNDNGMCPPGRLAQIGDEYHKSVKKEFQDFHSHGYYTGRPPVGIPFASS